MKTFEDERGIIEDLKVGKDWSVTYISFKKGAVRGNHYHEKTVQVDYIISGKLVCAKAKAVIDPEYQDIEYSVVKSGDVVTHIPFVSHSYQALEDSAMVSMCKGVRIGENYEEDTFRLETPLL